MTGGVGLPVHEAALDALRQIELGKQKEPTAGPGSLALKVVRAFLAGGAADSVAHCSRRYCLHFFVGDRRTKVSL